MFLLNKCMKEKTKVEVLWSENADLVEWKEGAVLERPRTSLGYYMVSLKKVRIGSHIKNYYPHKVRPLPPLPLSELALQPVVGNAVEVYDSHHHCWRRGYISQILPNNFDDFQIFFPHFNSHFPSHRRDIRRALDWQDYSRWVPAPNSLHFNSVGLGIPKPKDESGLSSVGSSSSDIQTEDEVSSVGRHHERIGVSGRAGSKRRSASFHVYNGGKRLNPVKAREAEQTDIKHEKRLRAYRQVLKAFYDVSSSSLSWNKYILLNKLQQKLNITIDEHLLELERLRQS